MAAAACLLSITDDMLVAEGSGGGTDVSTAITEQIFYIQQINSFCLKLNIYLTYKFCRFFFKLKEVFELFTILCL